VKLLFDQNISFKVAQQLSPLFPDCEQLRNLKLENKSDREIWDFAKLSHYAIVTFDADFYDLVTLYGHPPKVIWLRIGNTTSKNLIAVLQSHADIIKSFLTDPIYATVGCLEISLETTK
jgi:predicted nuclease of predicted toxin-antitoxin system